MGLPILQYPAHTRRPTFSCDYAMNGFVLLFDPKTISPPLSSQVYLVKVHTTINCRPILARVILRAPLVLPDQIR